MSAPGPSAPVSKLLTNNQRFELGVGPNLKRSKAVNALQNRFQNNGRSNNSRSNNGNGRSNNGSLPNVSSVNGSNNGRHLDPVAGILDGLSNNGLSNNGRSNNSRLRNGHSLPNGTASSVNDNWLARLNNVPFPENENVKPASDAPWVLNNGEEGSNYYGGRRSRKSRKSRKQRKSKKNRKSRKN